jgi:hypothetical protein
MLKQELIVISSKAILSGVTPKVGFLVGLAGPEYRVKLLGLEYLGCTEGYVSVNEWHVLFDAGLVLQEGEEQVVRLLPAVCLVLLIILDLFVIVTADTRLVHDLWDRYRLGHRHAPLQDRRIQ